MLQQLSGYLKKTGTLAIISVLVLGVTIRSIAETTVSWCLSTKSSQWVDSGSVPVNTNPLNRADSTLYIVVDPSRKAQVIDGWGGAINEMGWDAMATLSQASKDSVLNNLFNASTCGINIVRIPIGANDFSPGYYSCAETPNDYQMNSFTLARERLRLIPFLRGALGVRPDLKIWGSPWSPPAWMKTNNDICARTNITGGSLKQDTSTLKAYALYFEKWVNAMQAEDIPVHAVHVQNEPNIGNNYPSCNMSGAEMLKFIKFYLGPKFRADSVKSEIWIGTIQDGDYNGRVKALLDDAVCNSFTTGVGLQWGALDMPAQIRVAYPTKKIYQTELQCGNFFWKGGFDSIVAPNDWNYGIFTFFMMSKWITAGVNGYCQWNMVLDSSGKSNDPTYKWKQNSMISVFAGAKRVRYNPQYYVVKHFSRFVSPGAFVVSSTGNFVGGTANIGANYSGYSISSMDKQAFLNPDGSRIVVVRNSDTVNSKTVAIKVGSSKFKPTLPANSISTFVIGETVGVSRVQQQIEPLVFHQYRGVLFFTIPKTSIARLLKLEIIDARGRIAAVPLNQMSTGGDCFIRCDAALGKGMYFARLHFNGNVKTERVIFN